MHLRGARIGGQHRRATVGEDAGREGHGGRAVGFAGAAGLGALVGLFGGVIFGLRDAVRVCVTHEHGARVPGSLVGILSLAGYSMLWYAVGGAVLTSAVGVAVWAMARRGGRALDDGAVLGLTTGVLTFVLAHAALSLAARKRSDEVLTNAGRLIGKLEVGMVALLSAAALGLAVRALRRRLGKLSTFAAASVGLVCTLCVLACYGVWVNTVVSTRPLEAKTLLASAAVAAVACAFGFGVYLLCRAAVGWRRRPVRIEGRRGALITLGSAALLALAPALLRRRLSRALARAGREGAARAGGPPNILWIVMDTARADALSCYGYGRQTTPYLDAIASEGTVYERAFAASSWTLPSHASMFTGLLPARHGCTSERPYLPETFATVAELLSENGYRTCGYSANSYVSGSHNLARGFQRFELRHYGRSARSSLLLGRYKSALRMSDYGAREINQAAMRCVGESVRRRQPFFVFINYMEVHAPYGSTPRYGHWIPDTRRLRKALATSQDCYAVAAGALTLTDDEFALLRALYDGDMTYLDCRIRDLVEHVRRLGVLDDTVLIVTSDHGDEFGEHSLLGHGFFGLQNSVIQIPLVIRYPKRFSQGARRKHIVETVDIFPTILDVAEIDWTGKSRLQGLSLLQEPAANTSRAAVAESYLPFDRAKETIQRFPRWRGIHLIRRLKSVQTEDFKYLWASEGQEELYDLRKDPRETNNLIGELPHKVAELRALLTRRVGPLAARIDERPAG